VKKRSNSKNACKLNQTANRTRSPSHCRPGPGPNPKQYDNKNTFRKHKRNKAQQLPAKPSYHLTPNPIFAYSSISNRTSPCNRTNSKSTISLDAHRLISYIMFSDLNAHRKLLGLVVIFRDLLLGGRLRMLWAWLLCLGYGLPPLFLSLDFLFRGLTCTR
jgi:hypothetical protein